MTAARKRTGLWEMVAAARDEANRIRSVQAGLVRMGELEAEHPDQIRKADAFDDIADLIRTIIPVKEQVAALLAPIAAARARGVVQIEPPPDRDEDDDIDLSGDDVQQED